MSKLRVFESFSGVGSQAMALRNIGVDFEVVGISEVDKWALLAYDSIHNDGEFVQQKTKEEMLKEFKDKNIAYNFSTGKSEIPRSEKDIRKLYEAHIRSKNYGDIRRIDERQLPDFDLFTYSFPCKNISVAGQQAGFKEGSGTQSALIWECRKIINEKKPKYLLMENVKNLVGKKHKPLFDLWCKTLEDLGYVNYWKVLNGKNFKVPQNRERVIMVSIRKDIDDNTFTMPCGQDYDIRIKDILEEVVDSKYYINSSKLIFNDSVLEQLPLIGVSRGRYTDSSKTKTKQHLEINHKGISNSLTTVQTDNLVIDKPKIIRVDIPQKVKVRKYDVDTESLKKDLRKGKKESGLTNKQLSEILNKPITLVEHWFRNDNCFSIPDEDVWDDLKKILGIHSDVYDKSIKEFIEKEGIYEKANRCYFGEGISPTITVGSADEKIIVKNECDFVIRKLTENETWRLQGYTDEDFYKAKDVAGLSSVKLYERAGRGIVVPMLEEIFENLLKEYIKCKNIQE